MPKDHVSNTQIASVIRSVSFSDPNEASTLLSSSYADVCVEPCSAHGFDFTVTGVGLSGMQIYRSSSTSGARFTSRGHFDGFSISSMRYGTIDVSVGQVKHVVSSGMDLAVDAEKVDEVVLSEGSMFFGLVIGASDLQETLTARIGFEANQRICFKTSNTSAGVRNGYESICQVIMAGLCDDGHLRGNALAVQNLQDALLNMILFGTEHNYSQALLRGTLEVPAMVRRAIEYIQANAHLPISTTTIASELGIGVRSLQISFQRWLEITPHHYLRNVRLKYAREDLCGNGRPKVGDISKKWGFNSPGEFSRLYKQAFGESPLDTVFRRK